jgi:uncharacterized protein DUF3592
MKKKPLRKPMASAGWPTRRLLAANWFGWMLTGLLFLLLFGIGAMLKHPLLLLVTGERASGTVVGMSSSPPSSTVDSSDSDPLQAPVVEFLTSTGGRVRVSGRSYFASPSAALGEVVGVAYRPTQPRDAQLLLWKDFPVAPVGVLLGFVAFLLLLWISFILVSEDPACGDPFQVLTTVIGRFNLNPFRFPILFLTSAAILGTVPATYVTMQETIDLGANGIKVVGHVTGFRRVYSRLNDRRQASGGVPIVTYTDSAGQEHTITESTVAILSRLKIGDAVEIIYLARQPDRGVRNKWLNLWISPMFFGFMALAFLWIFGLVWSGTVKN